MYFLLTLVLILTSCSSSETSDDAASRSRNPKGEYIYRKSNESFLNIPPAEPMPPKRYFWQSLKQQSLPKITKQHFRCKGTLLNPPKIVKQDNSTQYIYDCGGLTTHGLPLKNGKEFIYPILIDLLNYIQDTTKKSVVITSGHRCPEHNTYVDQSVSNRYSKHMIGAEVSFYVEGLEGEPEKIVGIIKQFYASFPEYQGKKDYEFARYEKADANVSIPPWFNKEVFIKIFSRGEGRNIDNSHPHPYLSIQVRYDPQSNEKVTYSWEKAAKNYHRK